MLDNVKLNKPYPTDLPINKVRTFYENVCFQLRINGMISIIMITVNPLLVLRIIHRKCDFHVRAS